MNQTYVDMNYTYVDMSCIFMYRAFSSLLNTLCHMYACVYINIHINTLQQCIDAHMRSTSSMMSITFVIDDHRWCRSHIWCRSQNRRCPSQHVLRSEEINDIHIYKYLINILFLYAYEYMQSPRSSTHPVIYIIYTYTHITVWPSLYR